MAHGSVSSGLASQKRVHLQCTVIPRYFWSCPSQALMFPQPHGQGGKFTPSSHWETDRCCNTLVDSTWGQACTVDLTQEWYFARSLSGVSLFSLLIRKVSQKLSGYLWGLATNDLPSCSGRIFPLGQGKKSPKGVLLLSFWRVKCLAECPPPGKAGMDLVYFFTLLNPFWKLSTKADEENDYHKLFVDSTYSSEGLRWSLSCLKCDAFEQVRVRWHILMNLGTFRKSCLKLTQMWFVNGKLVARGAMIFLNVSPSGYPRSRLFTSSTRWQDF